MDLTRGNAPIVVGVDGSDAALLAVRWAAQTAAGRHAPLTLLHAIALPDIFAGEPGPTAEALTALESRGTEVLAEAMRVAEHAVKQSGHPLPQPIETDLRHGRPAAELRSASATARMVVVGAVGHGRVAETVLGSCAAQIAAHADCPAVVVHGKEDVTWYPQATVVVGIDGSPLSEAALAAAFDEASFRRAPLTVLHAWSDSNDAMVFNQVRAHFDWEPIVNTQERLLAERLAGWSEKYPDVKVWRKLVQGRPRHELLELGKTAQLIVVGSRGRGGFTGLILGSTSQALIHQADCPVMVVRS